MVAVAPVVDLFPSIDIRSGRVVRLSQGEATRQTVYGDDPVAVAERFVEQGASWVHVVDLDRALGTGDNLPAVARIARRVGSRVRLQLGGGFRTLDLVRAGLDLGVARVVIGTAAAVDPSFVASAVSATGSERLVVGIDTREGQVALRGWTETSTERAEELARRVVADGIGTVIYTDIGRDGMLGGPDLAGAAALLATGARVIVSGGVASAEDIRDARASGLAGVIVGRALYEGRLTLSEALAACHPSAR
ncbi:MAG TPA: 1-(5-phosphoribosyl)-5-[(5-phosphoribosylamino)methylideneamino]imidazole-4-carboxamide isomerase [Gemmatimonadales bacterium]|nr:1-(5-phosphoribosyl)-5-[(5-phosphoribosylamino)methylideneamino]imidazole-4-carboxamide isomerase [Gemmatimonadales bacterium]